jgi:hypothetical protein
LRGVSPPVTRRSLIGEQALLAELHLILQVAFGWNLSLESEQRPAVLAITGHSGWQSWARRPEGPILASPHHRGAIRGLRARS